MNSCSDCESVCAVVRQNKVLPDSASGACQYQCKLDASLDEFYNRTDSCSVEFDCSGSDCLNPCTDCETVCATPMTEVPTEGPTEATTEAPTEVPTETPTKVPTGGPGEGNNAATPLFESRRSMQASFMTSLILIYYVRLYFWMFWPPKLTSPDLRMVRIGFGMS